MKVFSRVLLMGAVVTVAACARPHQQALILSKADVAAPQDSQSQEFRTYLKTWIMQNKCGAHCLIRPLDDEKLRMDSQWPNGSKKTMVIGWIK